MTITLRMTRAQAMALYGLILAYYQETRKPESDLTTQWINVIGGDGVTVEELFEMISRAVVV